jgi:hypothetical protein
MESGTIAKTCAILTNLMRGAAHNRKSIAYEYDITVASADRYIRALLRVPGVTPVRQGRVLTVRWYLTNAIREAGL